MLVSLAECPHAFPLGPDPDSNREVESRPDWPRLAGFPSPAHDDIERSFNFNDHLIRHPEATFLMRVTGDSLTEAQYHDALTQFRANPDPSGTLGLPDKTSYERSRVKLIWLPGEFQCN